MSRETVRRDRDGTNVQSEASEQMDYPKDDGTNVQAEPKRGAHVAANAGDNEWYTPPEYIAAARTVSLRHHAGTVIPE